MREREREREGEREIKLQRKIGEIIRYKSHPKKFHTYTESI